MNENENKNLIYALQALGGVLEDKDYTIRAKNFRIKELEKEVEDLTHRLASVSGCEGEDKTAKTIELYREYIMNLEAKVEELEERIAIMSESEAPAPMWDITPPKKETQVTEVTEVTNVTKVLEGE